MMKLLLKIIIKKAKDARKTVLKRCLGATLFII